MHQALLDASRVAHYHPLRPEVPLEVLTLDLCTSHGTTRMREAVEALAVLHSAGDRAAFHCAMTALSPWRNSYLYAKGLSRDAFPLLATTASSKTAIKAAEAFFSMRETDARPTHRLGLFLHVRVTDEETDDAYDSLSRMAGILQWLNSDQSCFQLTVVEIGFDMDRMGDRELEMVSKVLALALHEIKPTPSYKIEVDGIGRCASQDSFTIWGKLFQTMCRVGADRDANSEGNELAVSFAERADPRIVAALWSALAFSTGISRLSVRSSDAPLANDQAKYMALALLSPASQATSLTWSNSIFRAKDVDAVVQVQAASSRADLSNALWSSDWCSQSQVQSMAVNASIAKQYGWLLHDSGDGDAVDVFVPGFGQCSVKRDEWEKLSDGRQPLEFSGLFEKSKITRFESVVNLQEPTSCMEAARFVCVLGGSLQFIQLRPSRYWWSLDAVLTIFESCPNLRELSVYQLQLAPRVVEVTPARLVSTSAVKLKLHFVNVPSPTRTSGAFTETFFATVIPIIGANMEYLEIRKQNGIIPFARAFDAIARCCTSLFHLKLEHFDVTTLDPLIESYRGGTSRVSSLYLQKSPVESASLVRFAHFLADRSCVGSTKLGVLHITHFTDHPADSVQLRGLDAASIQAMLAMLEDNHSLTELYLGVTDTGVGQIVPEPLRPFKRRFDLYDEQEIPVASESFPVESTVAFADALQRKRLPFTQETIRIVTAFAAQRIRRSVRYDVVNRHW